MNAAENKELVQEIFAELATGNARPFVGHIADDFSWTVTGTTKWSRTYAGKEAVIRELFGSLGELLTPPITTIAQRFIADDDFVVVEARGKNTTKDGVPYNNSYCFVIRMVGGKLQELTEYLDTEMVTTVLGAQANLGATLSS